MGRDKYDFIQELLINNRLSQVQRKRILTLTSKEIKEDKELGHILDERVNRLEEMVGVKEISDFKKNSEELITTHEVSDVLSDSLNSNNENNQSINPALPKKYFYPSALYKFLLTYNQDPILKSTCHLIDGSELDKIKRYCNTNEYDYDKHYSKILESYKKLEKLFATYYTKALIRGFLTGKDFKGKELPNGWSNDNIKWNWGNDVLRGWCNKNKGIPPSPDVGIAENMENVGLKFDSPVKTRDKYLQSFGDVVIHFKKMFHIREDNSLLKVITGQNEHKKWDDKIDFQIEKSFFSENIEFFTDIDKVLQSYTVIIELIMAFQKDGKPKVRLSLMEKESSIYFSIKHINGIFGKSLDSAKSRLIGQKYEGVIDKLNGICDIYLQANFGQKIYAKFAIWNENWNIQSEREELEIKDDFQGGVEHILEFKRK